MSSSKYSVYPVFCAALIAAGLTCGIASAQDGNSTQDATMEADKQAAHHTMADMDTDNDGRLSRSEFAAAHGGKSDDFAAHDGNGDGFITQAEMDAHHAAMQANDTSHH